MQFNLLRGVLAVRSIGVESCLLDKIAQWQQSCLLCVRKADPHLSGSTEANMMQRGQRLVIIGRGGVGGPAAMLSKKLMPDVDVTIVGEEERFIVR